MAAIKSAKLANIYMLQIICRFLFKFYTLSGKFIWYCYKKFWDWYFWKYHSYFFIRFNRHLTFFTTFLSVRFLTIFLYKYDYKFVPTLLFTADFWKNLNYLLIILTNIYDKYTWKFAYSKVKRRTHLIIPDDRHFIRIAYMYHDYWRIDHYEIFIFWYEFWYKITNGFLKKSFTLEERAHYYFWWCIDNFSTIKHIFDINYLLRRIILGKVHCHFTYTSFLSYLKILLKFNGRGIVFISTG